MRAERHALGRPFVVLCGSSLFFYLSFQVLLPVIPLYAASLGGREAQVGLIIGVFAFAAMLPRPLAGQLADRIGRRPLVLVGAVVFALSSLGYALVGGFGTLLALRVFHGIGMGLGPTAAPAAVADLAPPERRGEAMGYFGLTSTGGMAVAPYVGIELWRRYGFEATFVTSAGLAALSVLLGWTLPETRPPGGAAPDRSRGGLANLFSLAAVYPSLLLFSLLFGFGGLISFLPLFAEREGLGNPGAFFTAFAVSAVVVRSVAGSLADRVGRRLVIVPALVVAGSGLLALATASGPVWLILCAVLYGVGFGAGQPALMAMATDRVRSEERGRAMGTLFTAWELAISSGSILLGVWAARVGYPAMWGTAAAVAWIGALAAGRDIGRSRG